MMWRPGGRLSRGMDELTPVELGLIQAERLTLERMALRVVPRV